MAIKSRKVIPLRRENQLLCACNDSLRQKMRRLGLILIKTTQPKLPYKPIIHIKPDPETLRRLEKIRQRKLETIERINQRPDSHAVATNINRLKTPSRKNQFGAASVPGPEAA